MFNLAAKLTWEGGDDVYDIEKRNVAVLYEYWLFFELLKIVENVLGIKPGKNLIVDTNDQLGLQLKQGKYFPIKGICEKHNRKLEVQFSYNRTFSGKNDYPEGGSWTRSMRPDYTLSIWPAGIDDKEAEKQELITHIHFDAKYKIEKIIESIGEDESGDEEKETENLNEEKKDQSKGTFKRADLLKMHAYKDAIRRTGGAYILYPGKEKDTFKRKGFRELIPGLGAFQIRPSENKDNGSKELEEFLEEVVNHFINRTSQREKTAYRIYDIHKEEPRKEDEVRDALPEAYGVNRSFLFENVNVLIGFYDEEKILEWIESKRLYNCRTGTDMGSLTLGFKETNASYLLLHTHGEAKNSTKIYKLKKQGPRIYSKLDLIKKGYPREPRGELYLIYELEKENITEFSNYKWDITTLEGYKTGSGSGIPFSVTLAELMRVRKR